MGGPAWLFDGIIIGATRTCDMRNMMAVTFAIYSVSAIFLVASFGNFGLWAALLLSFAVRGVTLALRFPSLVREFAP